MTSKALAVIPARGGSKGLPGKNILPLAGIPLLGHSVQCAKASKSISRIVVSTDSEEIAKVAKECGADVPFLRPANLAEDTTPMWPVLQHALKALEEHFDYLVLLDPTSPGRHSEEIDQAIAMLDEDQDAKGVVACSKPTFNPFWVGVIEQEGALQSAYGDIGKYERRQDVPTFYRINGSLYVWRTSFVKEVSGNWMSQGKHKLLELPEARAFSIDDRYEFDVAETLIAAGIVKLPWL